MPNWFYIDAFGQQQGPISDAQLKKLVAQQMIDRDTPLETDTGHKGKAGQIKGLFPAAPTPQTAEVSSFFSEAEMAAMQAERVSNHQPQQARTSGGPNGAAQVIDWLSNNKKYVCTIVCVLIGIALAVFSLTQENIEGKWVWEEGEGNNFFAKSIEFAKGGTGVIDDRQITWETWHEKVGRRKYHHFVRLQFNDGRGGGTIKYHKSFSTLTLEFADGNVKYTKQQGDAAAAKDAVVKGAVVKDKDVAKDVAVAVPNAGGLDAEKAIRDAFARYQAAIQNKNGKEAAEWLDKKTIDWYSQVLRGAKEYPQPRLRASPLLPQYMILEVRHRISKETLLAMRDGKELFIHSINNGILGGVAEKLDIETVDVRGNAAVIAVSSGGKDIPFGIRCRLVNGRWEMDMTFCFQFFEQAFRERVQQHGGSYEQFMFQALEQSSGRKPDDSIWIPLQASTAEPQAGAGRQGSGTLGRSPEQIRLESEQRRREMEQQSQQRREEFERRVQQQRQEFEQRRQQQQGN